MNGFFTDAQSGGENDMHIMLVNDDGWYGDGLQELARVAIARGHRVTVCAPDRPRSGAGHSFTFENALHVRPLPPTSAAPAG